MNKKTAKATANMLSRLVADEVKLRITATELSESFGMTDVPDDEARAIAKMNEAADHMNAAALALDNALGDWRM